MKWFSPILKIGFFASFIAGAAGLFLLPEKLAITAVVASMLFSALLILTYQSVSERFNVPSVSQRRKLILIVPLVIFLFFVGFIPSARGSVSHLAVMWSLFSLSLLFHFDTFASVLTYFGKRKPLVKDVRSGYHVSLLLLYFGVGAFIMAALQFVPQTQYFPYEYQSYTAAMTFLFLGVAIILAMSFSWFLYRSDHAEGERLAISVFGDEFIAEIKNGALTALPKEERNKYANQ
jgi:hypothetical protein